MGRGLNSYDEKERRKQRRQNHQEKDLRYPKRGRKFNPYTEDFYDE